LSGCHFGGSKTPTGQVVAVVGDREITLRELQSEMAGSTAATPAAEKAQQEIALNRIIQRVILANAAKKQGLDKDPSYALLKQRADEMLLAQMLEKKLETSVPPPTKEEVEQFQQTNPNLFAERKILDVEQIRLAHDSNPDFIAKFKPLKTMDQVADFLNQSHIPFQRGTNTMDAVGQNPKLLDAILALPPHEVFVLSTPTEVFVNEIQDVRTQPFEGDAATKYAVNYLKSQHLRDAVSKQLGRLIASARSSVRINKEYQPQPAPKTTPAPKKVPAAKPNSPT
jgi:EpsD family peptidyl-prolyl cis-trans isomerase